MNDVVPYPTDYLDTLQQAALAFLQRHGVEHLGEQVLFSRAVAHLVATMHTRQELAENIVARAYGELRNHGGTRYLDVSASTSHLALLVDPDSGIRYAVPVASIFALMIDTPARRHLRTVAKH